VVRLRRLRRAVHFRRRGRPAHRLRHRQRAAVHRGLLGSGDASVPPARATGRFTQRDPLGPWGDPLALGNPTTYAANNPWTYTDPLGLCAQGKAPTLSETEKFLNIAGAVASEFGASVAESLLSIGTLGFFGKSPVEQAQALEDQYAGITAATATFMYTGEAALTLAGVGAAYKGAKGIAQLGQGMAKYGSSPHGIATRAPSWRFGGHKSAQRWNSQMGQRGWAEYQISDAIQYGKMFNAPNRVNPRNSAIRFVHPETGKSIVLDTRTKELLQLGGHGFRF